MNHLVLGATGGLGNAIVRRLIQQGETVKAFVRNREKANKYFNDLPNVELFEGDALKPDDLKAAAEGAEVLYFCIGLPHNVWVQKFRSLLAVSVEAACNNNNKFIFPGNVYVYGRAQTLIVNEKHPFKAHTKKGLLRVEMERMLSNAAEENNLKYSIIRMPDFYGPYVINGFSEKLFINSLTGKSLQWFGDLDLMIEFIFIEDAARAMIAAGMSDKSIGKSFNVSGYSLTTPREYLAEISRQGFKASKIRSLKSGLILSAAGIFSPAAKEFREMLYLKKERFILDGSLFKSTFGNISQTSYKEGIKKTLRWARKFYNL